MSFLQFHHAVYEPLDGNSDLDLALNKSVSAHWLSRSVLHLATIGLTIICLGLLCSFWTAPAAAQDSSTLTPRQVAEAYMDAMNHSDWARAAANMHPQSLAVIHKVFIQTYESSNDQDALKQLYGVENLEAFRNLSPDDFFVRFMGAVLGQNPNFAEAMRHVVFKVDLEEQMSPSEVYIRYTATIDAKDSVVSDSNSLTLRHSTLGWKVYSTPDLEPLLQAGADEVVADPEADAPPGAQTHGKKAQKAH